MKFKSSIEYILSQDFNSQLFEYFINKDNDKIVSEIISSWLESKFKIYDIDEEPNIFMETIFVAKSGFDYIVKEDGLYVSGYYLILSKIFSSFIKTLPLENQYPDIILKILNGVMIHEYYSISGKGEELIDQLEFEADNKVNPDILQSWDTLMTHYTEEIFTKKENEIDVEISKIYKKLLKKQNKKSINEIREYYTKLIFKLYKKNGQRLKFSKDGIKFLKGKKIKDNIIKGFKEIRIKRFSEFNITLLIGIITTIYFEKELFLYFDPIFYQAGLVDRENLDIKGSFGYIIVNFTNIIKSIFCEHCLKEKFHKDNINKINLEDNKEIVKLMFDELLNQINKVHLDDLYIKIEGRIKDNNKFNKINEAIKSGKVSFMKHDGKKNGISFEIKKNLKKYTKNLKGK